jgi:capsular polysaccharide biosynthesis protein
MSQQSLDLRTSLRIARRYRVLIGGLAAVGLLAGIGYTVINPPKATSEALVVIPQLTSSADATVTNDGTVVTSGTETQVLVAGSDPVLQAALPDITPAMTLTELRMAVQTSNPAGAIIAIDGHSTSGAQAIDVANAVAKSYVAYVTSAKSPTGRVNASLLEPAATSTGDNLAVGLLPGAVIGLIAGALIGFIIALAKGRNERRLRQRDAIANAIGVPVLASMPVAHPSDAAAWTELLDEYEPSVVPAWQLRKMLSQLGIPSARSSGGEGGAPSLAVLSLSSDKPALALGPQLATFAASLGIRTVLAIGQEQDPAAGATLYTACAVPPGVAPRRGRPLRTQVVGDKEAADVSDDAELVVLVIVSDGAAPRMPDTMRTDLTVLGVSAGAATAEELARIAMAADADGRGITGILVADPDSTDRTTGRIPQLAGIRRRIPTRATGIPTESRR